ncbi:ABC transporter ATP-binding protein [Pseudonocardia acaciae]|uniref:ABC transporter ATP-binding protein n=1 Tax=Pseudonocardia acaciae TaxID=551276 RepID=UPI00068687A9|nr:ABC transporter ATP-binding protein [Pseudonocardia acaciae]
MTHQDVRGREGRPEAATGDVRLSGISHGYGGVDVLHEIDLAVEHGEFLTLLGPSGSGKSTLLRLIGGLERPGLGSVHIGGRDVTALPTERRDVGVVFQNYALFPHLTVAQNVAFPLRMRKVDGGECARRVGEMLDVVELGGMGERHPGELSGGQQQRVALARALVFRPRLLLLDEPFGALDRRLREQLGLEVRRLQRELGITTVFVTHDQDEAFTMSTRIAAMGAGRVLQVDAPAEVYRAPASLEVARLLGNLNEFSVRVVGGSDGGGVELAGPGEMRFSLPAKGSLADGETVRCGVRPEHVAVRAEADGRCFARARVIAAIFGGGWVRAQLDIGDHPPVMATLPHDGTPIADGDEVWFGFDEAHGMLFDQRTGQRVG